MSELRSRHPKIALALGLALLALSLWSALAWPAKSHAYTVSVYCDGRTLQPFEPCEGAERNMYAVEGWGERSICVFARANAEFGRVCNGDGAHIYDPFGGAIHAKPGITNWSLNGVNTVHGRAYQP
jgi:hypothetical protein